MCRLHLVESDSSLPTAITVPSTKYVDPPETPSTPFHAFPSDIIHLLFEAFDDSPRSTLVSLARCSWDMHDRFAPILHRKLVVDKGNMRSVFAALPLSKALSESIGRSKANDRERKMALLAGTTSLTVHDLPALDHLSRVLNTDRHPPSKSMSHPSDSIDLPRLPTIRPSMFASLHTLCLSGKAVLALADLYNASSWGSSASTLPSNPILRALRDHLQPKRLELTYPPCSYPPLGVSLHMHSCIEDVVSYLTSGWNLDVLEWKDLTRSMVGPVPKARQLHYAFEPTSCAKRVTNGCADAINESLKGCLAHYDHVSLTCHTFLDHLIAAERSKGHPSYSPGSGGRAEEVGLTMTGLGCLFSLDWQMVVQEVWSRMGTLEEGDWTKIERWRRAKVILSV